MGRQFIVFLFVLCAMRAEAATWYVNASGTNPVYPYSSWATAATNIEDAAAQVGFKDVILVTNGIYQYGKAEYDPCRVYLEEPTTLQSVNGPSVTVIVGSTNSAQPLNGVAIFGGTLAGFTISNCAGGLYIFYGGVPVVISNCIIVKNTDSYGGGGADFANANENYFDTNPVAFYNCSFISNSATDGNGGGAYGGNFFNCTFLSNSAPAGNGGGAYGSNFYNCTFLSNSAANGGGAYGGSFSSCTFVGNGTEYDGYGSENGGGAAGGTFYNCNFSNNYSLGGRGGGVYNSTLSNCVLCNNMVGYPGTAGGAFDCNLFSCLVVSNAAGNDSGGGGIWGGGARDCIIGYNTPGGTAYATLVNCTIVANSGGIATFYGSADNCIFYSNSGENLGAAFSFCCGYPQPLDSYPPTNSNFTADPLFVNPSGGDYHLQSNSPCINSGLNAYVTNATDFDGNPRIVAGTVDCGAYEFQTPASIISYQWLQQYGFPMDGTADFSDPDGDGMNNYQEWLAGTNPTNSSSSLQILGVQPTNGNLAVTWSSVNDRHYSLLRSTNLPNFSVVQTNIPGQTNLTSWIDTNTFVGQVFYKLGVGW